MYIKVLQQDVSLFMFFHVHQRCPHGQVIIKKPAALSVSTTGKSKSHLPPNLSAKNRVEKFATGTFHEGDGLMFCLSYNMVIDHLRKSVIDKHLESAVHKQKAEQHQSNKQQMLKTVINCKIAD